MRPTPKPLAPIAEPSEPGFVRPTLNSVAPREPGAAKVDTSVFERPALNAVGQRDSAAPKEDSATFDKPALKHVTKGGYGSKTQVAPPKEGHYGSKPQPPNYVNQDAADAAAPAAAAACKYGSKPSAAPTAPASAYGSKQAAPKESAYGTKVAPGTAPGVVPVTGPIPVAPASLLVVAAKEDNQYGSTLAQQRATGKPAGAGGSEYVYSASAAPAVCFSLPRMLTPGPKHLCQGRPGPGRWSRCSYWRRCGCSSCGCTGCGCTGWTRSARRPEGTLLCAAERNGCVLFE